GAGGSGFMLLYCEEEHQPAVRQAFSGEGIEELTFAFDFAGSRVLVNDPFLYQHATPALVADKAAPSVAGASQGRCKHSFWRRAAGPACVLLRIPLPSVFCRLPACRCSRSGSKPAAPPGFLK